MEAGILFALVFVFLLIGVPVAISLGLSSVLLIAFFSHLNATSKAVVLCCSLEKSYLLTGMRAQSRSLVAIRSLSFTK